MTHFTSPSRPAALALLGSLALFVAVSPSFAQEENVGEPRKIVTKGGWPLQITYYPSAAGKNSPVAILLHAIQGNRLVWELPDGLAEQLNKKGFAVITVDLRKHGESVIGEDDAKKKLSLNDYKLMVLDDMEAVKKFVFQEHQNEKLNMSKIGIVAVESTAAVAMMFTYNDWIKPPYDDAANIRLRTRRGQDVRALALLSPVSKTKGVNSARYISALKSKDWGIGFWLGVGSGDKDDKGQTKKLHQQLRAGNKGAGRIYMDQYQSKQRGTDLLGKDLGVEEHIVTFLGKLSSAGEPWQDRRSRLNR